MRNRVGLATRPMTKGSCQLLVARDRPREGSSSTLPGGSGHLGWATVQGRQAGWTLMKPWEWLAFSIARSYPSVFGVDVDAKHAAAE